ncbi:relaxase/mobilization nuclease and DUF3363 domain-containing protein [Pseudomonas sp. Q2-TVG4-2]|uniref:relaxase/mobilization nuclease and DUF3363 domain-containing protein n=1 Tax=Pseudomonas sp. Q2-TVG4-2 TaxID=1685699 RepID=UPI0015E7BF95|nr:relaxase/mobilization nuclease and DUF3363 domain-containing protein [Pseudomonas sp. Q2-TVG4-2]
MNNRRDRTRDDRLQPKVGSPKQRGQSFVTRILRQASKAGAVGRKAGHQPGARLGRGHVAARFNDRGNSAYARRVTIKTRLVNLRKAGQRSTASHLRYIEREGVGRDGEPGQAYGPMTDRADLEAFEARGRDDRHQFRFIVSPEDAESLDELRTFTRHLMDRVETDLGTRLDWVAVDHWNTDNPHTHIALRGKDDTGRDLVIARGYIAQGMRDRASELATEWLGPRTEIEIQRSLQREVDQDRMTSLDRTLLQRDQANVVRLEDLARHPRRQQLIGRLQHLERLGLARQGKAGQWHINDNTERTLRALGERGDIVRTMQRAMSGIQREQVVFQPGKGHCVTGRLLAKGLAGESHDRVYLVLDGTDGKAHYLTLPERTDLTQYPLGAVIEASVSPKPREIDRRIAALAIDGLYQRERHRAVLVTDQASGFDPQVLLDAHERRLEALRRAGIVERTGHGLWRVPSDLVERGWEYDAQRCDGLSLKVCTPLSVERQARAMGATWLDQQLVGNARAIAGSGFGAQVRDALRQRTVYLVEQGLATRQGMQVILSRNLLATLRGRELEAIGRNLEAKTGLRYRPAADGAPITGIYQRSLQLASGRYALLEDRMGFSLVPWKPVIEPKLGQSVTAVIQGNSVSWHIGRPRGPAVS